MKNIGFHLSIIGVALILIWIGLFKFTPTEARAIEPLVRHSPFMGWLYRFFSVQTVSILIGTAEIATGLLLLLKFVTPWGGLIGGFLATMTFVITLSFLFTTPGAVERVDGFILPDAFILKDLIALGVSVQVMVTGYRELFYEVQ